MAQAVWDSDGGDAIHRSLLDPGVRHSASRRTGGVSGECAGDQESAGQEIGRAGKPMADEAAHLWAAAEFLPAGAGDPEDEDLLAPAERSDPERRAAHPAHAEGTDRDERAVGECDQRFERSDRPGHPKSDSGGRTRSPQAGRVAGLPGEGHPRTDCPEPGGELAGRLAVPPATRTRGLRVLPKADGGLRYAVGTVPQGAEDRSAGAPLEEEK